MLEANKLDFHQVTFYVVKCSIFMGPVTHALHDELPWVEQFCQAGKVLHVVDGTILTNTSVL
jgi:hypothetical protein